MSYTHGVDSEVGALRSVLVHRPGPELKRLTARTRDRLLLTRQPWVGGAQQEHDRLTQALRDRGVEVLYVTELLQDTLEYEAARAAAIASVTGAAAVGDELAGQVAERLGGLGPEDLARVLIAGLAAEDLPGGRGLAYQLLRRADFVIDPLPDLVFTRDCGFWVGDRPGVASLAAPHRRREADLLALIYGHHPRFRGSKPLYGPQLEPLDGGDVLLLAPGVLAIGVGQRTTAAGAERLARHALDAGLAHTVLAIPLDQPARRGLPGHPVHGHRRRHGPDAPGHGVHPDRSHTDGLPWRNEGVPATAVPGGGGPRPGHRAAERHRCRSRRRRQRAGARPPAGAVPRAQHRGDRAARGRRGDGDRGPRQ